MANLAIFAILPLGLLAGLLASGVLSLHQSEGGDNVLDAFLLRPVGVIVTGKGRVELPSADGKVTVVVPAGSVSAPAIFDYTELEVSESPAVPV